MNSSDNHCDVLIVGAGPAGSTCARRLHARGIDVRLIDKARFPRDKVCAGWITPAVVRNLTMDLEEYREKRTLQPITGFRVGLFGERTIQVEYDTVVSYGIRRCELDEFLLRKSGVMIHEGEPVRSIQHTGDGWLVNDSLQTGLLIGAGGHFCPVARHIAQQDRPSTDGVVAAQEAEFRMSSAELASCRIEPEVPELYFYPDLLGYAWCVRKQDYINIGLGRVGEHNLARHREELIDWLVTTKRIGFRPSQNFHGHAYRLAPYRRSRIVADRLLLIGDAAGLASSQSGEGIRPAIESGLMAADFVATVHGDYSQFHLNRYAELLTARFGAPHQPDQQHGIFPWLRRGVGRRLLRRKWFVRSVVLDRWFLNRRQRPYDSVA